MTAINGQISSVSADLVPFGKYKGQPSTPILTTREAIVQTVSVSIQTLRVGTKQVTMGLFRQLPSRPLVRWWDIVAADANGWWEDEEECPLRIEGTPWGHVSYWWAENERENAIYCREDGTLPSFLQERRHMLWEQHGCLYRDIVYACIPEAIFTCEGTGLNARRHEIVCWWHAMFRQLADLPQLFIAV